MKKQFVLLLSMSWIALSLVISVQVSHAQNAPTGAGQTEPVKLTGGDVKSEDAILKTDVLFIGQITHLGFGNLKAQGEAVYRGMQIKVIQILRGSLQPESTFTLRVFHVYSSDEYPPTEGSSYIFFAKRNDPSEKDAYAIVKLLPATDANVTKVKALTASAPASK